MYEINKLPPAITLGYQGESLARTIEVDCADWLETYPSGTMAATILLPGYGGVAPLPVDMDGTVMSIPVTRGMTAKAGRGSINLRLLDDDVEKRSAVVPVYIQTSHPPVSGEMPDPVQDWVAAAQVKLGETIAATESANAAAGLTTDAIARANAIAGTLEGIAPRWSDVDISVSALDEGVAPTASITQGENGTSISLGIPKGDTGEQGIQGEKGDTGAKIVTAAWSGNDLLLTLDDTSTVTLTGAKTTLKGDPGDISNIKIDGATKAKSAGVVDLTSDFARYAIWRKTSSGNPVSVYPVPESPLYARVSGMPIQEGEGDPSPENIRTITPWLSNGASVSIVQTDGAAISLTAPQDIWGGWMDNEGKGESEWRKITIDGTQVLMFPNTSGDGTYIWIRVDVPATVTSIKWFSPLSDRFYSDGGNSSQMSGAWRIRGAYSLGVQGISFYISLPSNIGVSANIESFRAWFGANPFDVFYPLQVTSPLTLTPAPLTALPQLDRITPRQNVLTASTGNIELTYAKSPIRESDEIATAIAES